MRSDAIMAATRHTGRIRSIDTMRGLVMLLMLIDHSRERFFLHHNVSDPMDIQHTDPALFWTRISAHLCAPVFVFLTGLSAWLYAHPASGPRSPAGFLVQRGLLLIGLEVTVLAALWFSLAQTIYLQVIWAIGLCMLVLAAVHRLPRHWLLATGLLLVGGHNLLTPIQFEPGQWGYSLWTILHDRGYWLRSDWINIKVSYPLLPWIGVILLGYSCGPLFGRDCQPSQRLRWLLQLGAGCLALLVVLRGSNVYGETRPWQPQDSLGLTLMDMANFTKYPPSLDFLLLTLGLMFLLLALFERLRGFHNSRVEAVLVNFGSAPMFFYILHLYALWLALAVSTSVTGTHTAEQLGIHSIQQVWLIAAGMAVLLYFPTRWFGRLKQQHRHPWLKLF